LRGDWAASFKDNSRTGILPVPSALSYTSLDRQDAGPTKRYI
jgi:hypothetical protein